MNLIIPYKIPKNQELFKRPLELGFKLLTDLGQAELNFAILLAYIIDLTEHPKKFGHSQILGSQ